MKKLTKSVIIDMLQKDIADNKRDNEQHNIIYEFLKANDGKKIDGWLIKKLPEGMKHEFRAGMHNIKDRNNMQHLISYDNIVKAELFHEKYDTWATIGALERIANLEALLSNPDKLIKTFISLQKTFNTLCVQVKELEAGNLKSFRNPIYYDLLRCITIPTSLISDIQYDKLENK